MNAYCFVMKNEKSSSSFSKVKILVTDRLPEIRVSEVQWRNGFMAS